MTQKLEAQGTWLNDRRWDDGSDHDGVSKIYIGCGTKGIDSIYFDYVKSGKSIEGSRHGLLANNMVEINLLENEYLESVSGTYRDDVGVCSLVFNSNFKTIGPIMSLGHPPGSKALTLAVKGKKIIGFHGSAFPEISSLGAHFTWITPTRVEAKGRKGGKQWDDGYDHEDVTKIYVQGGDGGIQSIQFEYVRNGVLKKGALRGVSSGGNTETYEIKYLTGEYLMSVEGYYDTSAIQGIQFRTNKQTFERMGLAKGRKFTLASNWNKITGFHGYADETTLISIGAYFTTAPCKLECVGDTNYKNVLSWDDGSGYDGIRKVFVDATDSDIKCIRFEYENRGKVIKTHRRPAKVENEKEFVIDYPNEFITSVEGSLENGIWFRSLTIKTSKGRTSPTFGVFKGSKFVIEKPGNILVGFHGTAADNLVTLGAYYRPLPPPVEDKLENQGGHGGDYWDDGGTFHRIRRIYIGLTENGIAFVKFLYVQNDDRVVFGDDHGSKTLSDIQEFTIGDPAEYLTSVEGDYDDNSGVITKLKFTTNKTNSRVFGVCTTSRFTLHKNGYQIVGFHGKSSDMLHQIGVHVLPINS